MVCCRRGLVSCGFAGWPRVAVREMQRIGTRQFAGCCVSSCASLDVIIMIGDLLITFTKFCRYDGHMAHLICRLVQYFSLQRKNRYTTFHIWQLWQVASTDLHSWPVCRPNELSCEGLYCPSYIKRHNFIICGTALQETALDIQGVTGGMDQTSGECSLGQTIPI